MSVIHSLHLAPKNSQAICPDLCHVCPATVAVGGVVAGPIWDKMSIMVAARRPLSFGHAFMHGFQAIVVH